MSLKPWYETPEYRTWSGMIQRCCNPKTLHFENYGGRGITVCNSWRESFDTFRRDMGPRPAGCSIERIDNSKGYEPGNCRWATFNEQQRNKRSNHLIFWNGETRPISEWAEILGLKYVTLQSRINRGWPLERAMSPGLAPLGFWAYRWPEKKTQERV